MRILAISGSLRDSSSNTILLNAMIRLAPEDVEIILYQELNELPHFNPDFDGENVARSVSSLRRRIKSADGVLISSPEYAHGVPGVLKNALDWLVSSGETVEKPFALINANPRAHHAQEQLVEILGTMAAKVYTKAAIAVPIAGKNLDENEIIADATLTTLLRSIILDFAGSIANLDKS
ncbi:MAG: NAD(P)H-dependent oxidoreductase [Pyrinomonadaceae bacterium]|nr:NAD(P)H-dependent oxidoreductase [Pyrinomonadaceae bacterium]